MPRPWLAGTEKQGMGSLSCWCKSQPVTQFQKQQRQQDLGCGCFWTFWLPDDRTGASGLLIREEATVPLVTPLCSAMLRLDWKLLTVFSLCYSTQDSSCICGSLGFTTFGWAWLDSSASSCRDGRLDSCLVCVCSFKGLATHKQW